MQFIAGSLTWLRLWLSGFAFSYAVTGCRGKLIANAARTALSPLAASARLDLRAKGGQTFDRE
jgi:hypothetical protein